MGIQNNIWQTHRFDFDKIPDYIKTPINSWMNTNTNFNYTYMSTDDKNDFMSSFESNELRKIFFSKEINAIHKADIWRVAVVYAYGGFYADADLMCIESIDDMTQNDMDSVVSSIDNSVINKTTNVLSLINQDSRELTNRFSGEFSGDTLSSNQFFGAIKNSHFLEIVINKMVLKCASFLESSSTASQWKFSRFITAEDVGPGAFDAALMELIKNKEISLSEKVILFPYYKKYINICGSKTWNDFPLTQNRIDSMNSIIAQAMENDYSLEKETANAGCIKIITNDGHGRASYG
jgi:mannosyltransferase OCH1-like enzyme